MLDYMHSIHKLMERLFLLLTTVIIQFIADAQHTNVRISRINSPEEPTICLNYANPQYIVAGSNMKQYNYSNDGGHTWNYGFLESTYGVAGDPCIVADNAGNMNYAIMISVAKRIKKLKS